MDAVQLTETDLFELKKIPIAKALAISSVASLRFWDGLYHRLYFGTEFCENINFDLKVLLEVIRFVTAKKIPFTFVSSYLSQAGVEQMQRLIIPIFKKCQLADLEVVINDWALLDMLRDIDCQLVLGRFLVKQKCDPRILSIKEAAFSKTLAEMKRVNINSGLISLLQRYHIGRVELDVPLSGLDVQDIRDLKISLHWPFGYLSISRVCAHSFLGDNQRQPISTPCNQDCRKKFFTLKNENIGSDIYVCGKAYFFCNKILDGPFIQKNKNIDRIVVHPQLLA